MFAPSAMLMSRAGGGDPAPPVRPAAAAWRARTEWGPMSDSTVSPRPTVLVVDDDADFRQTVARVLESQGYVVERMADGLAVVDRLARGDVDLMLLDLILPGLDGLDLCRRARAAEPPGAPYLPILMLTGRCQPQDQRDGFTAGADDYITKPCDIATLRARVAVWLRVRRASQAALAAQAHAEAARQAAQVEAIHLTARALADRLNNELGGIAGVLNLVELEAAISEEVRELLPDAAASLDRACQAVTHLYDVTCIATHDTPLGPALDLERSAAPDAP
jgi:DNA-binding response OmpR family regulator